MYSAEVKVSEDASIPHPKGYKMLVAVPSVEEKTAGGIFLPDKLKDAEKVASIFGNVIAMGDLCYADAEKFPTGPWCHEGDWVIFRSYSGTRMKIDGQEYRLINDDTVEAVVDDPRKIQRA